MFTLPACPSPFREGCVVGTLRPYVRSTEQSRDRPVQQPAARSALDKENRRRSSIPRDGKSLRTKAHRQLAADSDLEVGSRRPPSFSANPHQLSDAFRSST